MEEFERFMEQFHARILRYEAEFEEEIRKIEQAKARSQQQAEAARRRNARPVRSVFGRQQ